MKRGRSQTICSVIPKLFPHLGRPSLLPHVLLITHLAVTQRLRPSLFVRFWLMLRGGGGGESAPPAPPM